VDFTGLFGGLADIGFAGAFNHVVHHMTRLVML
jgi:hypothetical protein